MQQQNHDRPRAVAALGPPKDVGGLTCRSRTMPFWVFVLARIFLKRKVVAPAGDRE